MDLSLSHLGLLLLVFGLSSFVAMIASGRLVNHIGARNLLAAGGACLSISTVGPGFATSPAYLTVALVVFGLAAGFHDAGQNAHAAEVERAHGRPIFNTFFALFSIGGLAAAGLNAVARALGIDIHMVFIGSAACCLIVTSVASRFLLRPVALDAADRPSMLPWTSQTVLLGSASFALLLAEGVALDWSAVHLKYVLHADSAVAGAAFGAFCVATTLVRLRADRVTLAIGPLPYLRIGTAVAVLGMGVVAISSAVAWAIIGWAVFGLGIAGCAGQVYSAAGALNPAASGAILARVTAIGYVGLLAGPSLIGLLAPRFGLRAAFVVPIACCVYAFVVAPRVVSRTPRQNRVGSSP